MLQAAYFAALLSVQSPVPSTPDVSGWTQTASRELEFRTDDYTVAFVGQVIDYQDPSDPSVFVRAYLRHPVVLSERARERSGHEQAQTGVDLRYHVAEQEKVLERAQQDGETFAYWRVTTVRDPRTGQDIRAGDGDSWILNPLGTWVHETGLALRVTELSEPSLADPTKPQLVGIVFSLGEVSHILRVDPINLVAPVEKEGGVR